MATGVVTVVFPDDRAVFVDDATAGRTNEELDLEVGLHIVDLGEPENYSPPSQRVRVTGAPKMVAFSKDETTTGVVMGMGMAPPPVAIGKKKAAKKPPTKRKIAKKKAAKRKTAQRAPKRAAKPTRKRPGQRSRR